MKSFLMFVFLMLLCVPTILFGQEVVNPPVGFEWLAPVISFLISIPAVGKVLAVVFAIVAVVSACMTFIAVTVQSFCLLLEKSFKVAGAVVFGDKIAAIAAKIMPWLKYFSMFNVQKK
jgi:hypothetical protein